MGRNEKGAYTEATRQRYQAVDRRKKAEYWKSFVRRVVIIVNMQLEKDFTAFMGHTEKKWKLLMVPKRRIERPTY